jgi:gliding motility-associated-like protein
VAAVNSKNLKYRSCSNNTTFTTGIRNSNQNLKINYVTLSNNININFGYNTSSDLKSIDVFKSTDGQNYSLFKTINNSLSPINEIDLLENGNRRVYYYLVSKNTCGLFTDTSPVSTNIILENLQELGTNKLWWNKYFTWNSGVEKYVIFRETRLDETITNPFSQNGTTVDTQFVDNIVNEDLSKEKLCYKILGIENITGYTSSSNTVCMIGGLIVYFPNGIISRTSSNIFKPVGVYIDYTKSRMVIYNRWGKVVKEINDLNIGWDLSDSNNNFVETETYVYDAHIIGLDGKEINKSGTITVIR